MDKGVAAGRQTHNLTGPLNVNHAATCKATISRIHHVSMIRPMGYGQATLAPPARTMSSFHKQFQMGNLNGFSTSVQVHHIIPGASQKRPCINVIFTRITATPIPSFPPTGSDGNLFQNGGSVLSCEQPESGSSRICMRYEHCG